MVRHNQIRLFSDRLCGRFGRDCKTCHHAFYIGVSVSRQQSDIIPFLGQSRRGKLVEKIGDVVDRRHEFYFQFRLLPLASSFLDNEPDATYGARRECPKQVVSNAKLCLPIRLAIERTNSWAPALPEAPRIYCPSIF